MSNNYAVIIAGGKGERFWPLSKLDRPKQFIDIFGGKPLIRIAADRLAGAVPNDRIFIVTTANLVDATREAVPSIPPENIVGEPAGRDTAAACALGTALAASRGGQSAVVAILTSDHIMRDDAKFRETLLDSFTAAASTDGIVTIGIKPTHPATGFGYIETDAAAMEFGTKTRFHKALKFVEKPSKETAERYIAHGGFFWNAGMFVWKANVFKQELMRNEPDIACGMDEIEATIGSEEFEPTLRRIYPNLRRISVDYAVMEHARNIIMSIGDFGWDDVGSLVAIPRYFESDASGNTSIGNSALMDASGVISISADPGHMVAAIGVKDLVIVHTPTATLVCPKDRAQDIKKLVGDLPDQFR